MHERGLDHRNKCKKLQDHINDLEGQAACDELFNEPPPRYVVNTPERALEFLVPTTDGLWQEAKFVHQLLEG